METNNTDQIKPIRTELKSTPFSVRTSLFSATTETSYMVAISNTQWVWISKKFAGPNKYINGDGVDMGRISIIENFEYSIITDGVSDTFKISGKQLIDLLNTSISQDFRLGTNIKK